MWTDACQCASERLCVFYCTGKVSIDLAYTRGCLLHGGIQARNAVACSAVSRNEPLTSISLSAGTTLACRSALFLRALERRQVRKMDTGRLNCFFQNVSLT